MKKIISYFYFPGSTPVQKVIITIALLILVIFAVALTAAIINHL